MESIDNIYQSRRPQRLQVLAVNAGQDKVAVAAFIGEIGVSYPALLDEESAIARQYGVVGLPMACFVGADGIDKAGVAGKAAFGRIAGALLQ